jgi:hypothetical protein
MSPQRATSTWSRDSKKARSAGSPDERQAESERDEHREQRWKPRAAREVEDDHAAETENDAEREIDKGCSEQPADIKNAVAENGGRDHEQADDVHQGSGLVGGQTEFVRVVEEAADSGERDSGGQRAHPGLRDAGRRAARPEDKRADGGGERPAQV